MPRTVSACAAGRRWYKMMDVESKQHDAKLTSPAIFGMSARTAEPTQSRTLGWRQTARVYVLGLMHAYRA